MDEETKQCKNLIKAILMMAIKDMTAPYGDLNNRRCCKEAFDFMMNEKNEAYKDFLFWCELADFDPLYWKKLALMNLAYALYQRPWLRIRVINFLKGRTNRLLLKEYYQQYIQQKNNELAEGAENDNIA